MQIGNQQSGQRKKDLRTRWTLFIFIGCILLAFSLVFILTSASIYPLYDYGYIGDTIGGITGPVLSIAGSFLIYKSFQAQIEANENQLLATQNQLRANENQILVNEKLREDIERGQMLRQYDQIYELITALLDDYNKLEYKENVKADLAIASFLKEDTQFIIHNISYLSFLRSFAYIMESADFSSRKIYHFVNADKNYKRVLRSRFNNFYYIKLAHHMDIIKAKDKFSIYFQMSEKELKLEIKDKKLIYAQIALSIRNIEETIDTLEYKK